MRTIQNQKPYCSASTGNRTRITHVAGEYSSIEPSMLWLQSASTVIVRDLNNFWNSYSICIWISATNKTCRRCGEGVENASHITNNCKLGLVLSTKRHNAILHSLADLLEKNRMEVTLDKKNSMNLRYDRIWWQRRGEQHTSSTSW